MVQRTLSTAKGSGATVRRFDGAVLFTDIVGFSPLTENFAAEGPEGAEQLSALLDAYFGRMTDLVCRWGGDVTEFVGDSIVAVWPFDGDATAATGRAAACALDLQRHIDEVAAQSELARPLRQRLALGAGDLRLFVFDDAERGHWLLAGEALSQAADTNYRAEPGQVLLSAGAHELVRDCALGSERPNGEFALTGLDPAGPSTPNQADAVTAAASVPDTEAMLRFVPRLVRERNRAGQWPWPGEFRNVTVLFLGLTRLDVTASDALDRLIHTEELQARILDRYGGTHLHFCSDEKGVASVSAFGLPRAAHENDAERALGAAVDLIEGLRVQGIDGSVGAASGRAFYSDSGGSSRRRLGLVGTPANLAARLMSAAQGRVLCDSSVQQGARGFGFHALAPMSLKGIKGPVMAFEPRARADRKMLRFASGTVGREAECARVAALLQGLQRGQGGMLSIMGEAGIGKSRLLAETVVMAQEAGVTVLTGAGSAMESATPYFPWRRLLAQLLPPEPARRVAWLQMQLRDDERREPWLPLLEALVPLGLPPTEVTRHMDSAGIAVAIQELVCELLARRAATQPLLLVIDDLHWIDATSCALLQTVQEKLPQVLIAVGARPPDHAVVAQVATLLCSQPDPLRLDSLARCAVADLMCLRLGVRQAPPQLVDFLWARAGGHPFYVEELMIALRGAQLIEVQDGVCSLSDRFTDQASAAIPATLQGLIVGRFDRLHAVQQHALKLASVIGREFAVDALHQLLGETGERASLQPLLATLVDADLLQPTPTAVPMFEFKHAILRDVIYDLLPFAQRRELHRRVADWIEGAEPDLRLRHAELARHWEHAGEFQRALEHLQGAGEHAVSRYANRDAIAHLQRAQSLAETQSLTVTPARHALWQGLLGAAHHELFEYASAARHFRQSLIHLGFSVPVGGLRLIGALLRELVDQTWLRTRDAERERADAAADLQRASHIHERLAEIAYFDNRPLPLLYHTLSSLNMAERCGAVRETVDGFAALSIGYLVAGLRRVAQSYNHRSLELARRRGTPADRAYAHLVDMVFCATIGRWDRLEFSAAIALPIYRQLGAPVRWHQAQSLRYHADSLRGRFARGRQVLDDVRADLSRDAPAQVRSWILCSDMSITLACDEPRVGSIEALAEVLTPELHRADRARSQGLMAQAWLRLGESGRALAEVDAALATLAGDVPTAWHVTDGLAALAETCIALAAARGGAQPELQRRVQRACQTLSRYVSKSPVAAPRAALVAAQLHALRRENRAARAALRRALKAAQYFDMPYSEALALQRLAPFETDSVQRQVLLDRAAARFADAGTLRAAGAEREPSSAPDPGLSPGQRTSRP